MIRTRTDAALKIVVGLVISGAILGTVWAAIAPPIHTITGLAKSGDRVDGFLGREADNVFVASAMFIGLLCMLGVVTAVAVWQWRAYRGPLMVIALWIGMAAAGGAAAGTGVALAHWRYGTSDHKGVPLSPENRIAYFTEAPPVFMGHSILQVAVTLLLPAALAVLVYGLMVVATPRDDLGGWPPARTWGTVGPRITAAGTEPVHPA